MGKVLAGLHVKVFDGEADLVSFWHLDHPHAVEERIVRRRGWVAWGHDDS